MPYVEVPGKHGKPAVERKVKLQVPSTIPEASSGSPEDKKRKKVKLEGPGKRAVKKKSLIKLDEQGAGSQTA